MVGSAAREHLITFEEAARLDPDERGGEVDQGRWIPVTRNTWLHGEVVVNICALLKLYARRHPGWSVSGGDPGTKLGDEPAVLRGPDVAIVGAERRPTGRGAAGWLDGAPDVAVEVIGDDQSPSELARKALEYLGAGAKAVWVVDPEPRRVMVYTPPNNVQVIGSDETLNGGDALPGFSCQVEELFD